MLDYTKKDLQELGAEITTREIYQQPSVWKETARLYQERKAEIKAFLEKIGQEHGWSGLPQFLFEIRLAL